MAIRLTGNMRQLHTERRADCTMIVSGITGDIIALADTEAEAEQAKRAFELVLAPRFTRDEAISIVLAELGSEPRHYSQATRHGIRLALEALAAAGVFVDGRNMADKLDAAGIR